MSSAKIIENLVKKFSVFLLPSVEIKRLISLAKEHNFNQEKILISFYKYLINTGLYDDKDGIDTLNDIITLVEEILTNDIIPNKDLFLKSATDIDSSTSEAWSRSNKNFSYLDAVVPDYLSCPICLEPLIEPYEHTGFCKRIFCKECIYKIKESKDSSCPICFEVLEDKCLSKVTIRFINSKLDELKVKCDLCHETDIKRIDYKDHSCKQESVYEKKYKELYDILIMSQVEQMMQYACQHLKIEMINDILSKISDPGIKKIKCVNSGLIGACIGGHYEIADQMIKLGATNLHFVLTNVNMADVPMIVGLLIDQCIKSKKYNRSEIITIIQNCGRNFSSKGKLKTMKYLYDLYSEHIRWYSHTGGNIEVIDYCIELYSRKNPSELPSYIKTLIKNSCQSGHWNVLEYLLQKGKIKKEQELYDNLYAFACQQANLEKTNLIILISKSTTRCNNCQTEIKDCKMYSEFKI